MYRSIFFILALGLSIAGNVAAQKFPYGTYYYLPKNSDPTGYTWKIWENEISNDKVVTRFRDSTLTPGVYELADTVIIDTVFSIDDNFYFVSKKSRGMGMVYSFGTMQINRSKKEYKSALLWQVNRLNEDFYSREAVIEFIKNDTLPKLFAPLYSLQDAKKYVKMKRLELITEDDLLAILLRIKEGISQSNQLKASVSETKKRHSVHRFYPIAIYGSAFFEAGYVPFVRQRQFKKIWKEQFSSNPELVHLLDTLF